MASLCRRRVACALCMLFMLFVLGGVLLIVSYVGACAVSVLVPCVSVLGCMVCMSSVPPVCQASVVSVPPVCVVCIVSIPSLLHASTRSVSSKRDVLKTSVPITRASL